MTARLLAILAVVFFLVASPTAQISFERIVNAGKEPHNWLTYSGTYMSQRYSQLTQITPANAKDLELKWVFQARWLDYYQTTPLVVDGIMYGTQGNAVLGYGRRQSDRRVLDDSGSAGDQGQSHRRYRRRRVRDPRIHCRVRRQDW